MSADLITYLLSFPPSEPVSNREYCILVARYKDQLKRGTSRERFLKNAGTQQDVLELLDPSVNTIGYALALQANIGTNGTTSQTVPSEHKPDGPFWRKMTTFLEVADPVQLRFVGDEWRNVVLYVEHVARKVDTPAVAIPPILSALFRLDPTTGTFTSIHTRLVELCVEARVYALAVPILDNYIHSLPVRLPKGFQVQELEYSVPAAEHTNSAEYIDVGSGHSEEVTLPILQRYYVLGAVAYIGVRDFKSARDFLEYVLVTPCDSGAASGLMVEAYKKWTILNCLVDGKPQPLPRTTSTHAAKNLKAMARAYDAVAEAFVQFTDMAKLRAQINCGRTTWAEDGNAALVKELIDYQTRFYITGLSETYSALPISKISATLGSSEDQLLQYLETLIRDGHLNAQIDRTSKPELGVVLRFFLDTTQGPLAKSEKQQRQALYEQTLRTKTLAAQVKNADYLLSMSKDHMDYVNRQSRKAGGGLMGRGEDTEMGFEDGLDEDIMSDAR